MRPAIALRTRGAAANTWPGRKGNGSGKFGTLAKSVVVSIVFVLAAALETYCIEKVVQKGGEILWRNSSIVLNKTSEGVERIHLRYNDITPESAGGPFQGTLNALHTVFPEGYEDAAMVFRSVAKDLAQDVEVRRNAAKDNSGNTVLPFLADIKVPPPGGLKLDKAGTRFSGAWPTRCGSNSGAASQNATTPTVVLSNAGCLHHCG